MKKTLVRVLALALVAVTLVCTLASCGGVKSGKYYAGDMEITKTYTVYEFKGNKFTFASYIGGNKLDSASLEGTYKVKDGEITFTCEIDGEEKSDTVAFEETENGIKIGLIEYKLIED